jgi:TPR repeat protein
MSKKLKLVHAKKTRKVPVLNLVQKCTRFANDPLLFGAPYAVLAPVSVADFRQFVSALKDKKVEVTNANFNGLSLLSDEFGFVGLSERLSAFRHSQNFNEVMVESAEARQRRLALEERALQRDNEVALLRQAQESTAAALTDAIVRLSRIEAEMLHTLKSDVDQLRADIGALQSWRQSIVNSQNDWEQTMATVPSEIQDIRSRQNGLIAAVGQLSSDLGAFSRSVSGQQRQTQEGLLKAVDVRLSQVEAVVAQTQSETTALLTLEAELRRLGADVAALQSCQESSGNVQNGLERAIVTVTEDVERLVGDIQDVQAGQNGLVEAIGQLKSEVDTISDTVSSQEQMRTAAISEHSDGIPMEKDVSDAQFHCGLVLAKGDGVRKDGSSAAKYSERAADQGDVFTQLRYGLLIESEETLRGEKSIAAHDYRLAADAGDPNSQFRYALLLESGDGVPMNKSLAAEYYKLAADQGNVAGQFRYGLMLETGNGILPDKALAAEYYKQAADQGDMNARFSYAFLLDEGDGVPANKAVAAEYYKLAADQGHPFAQSNYGILLDEGDGVPQDRATAAHYYKLAADRGHAVAQCNYGLLLLRGDGIERDPEGAARY